MHRLLLDTKGFLRCACGWRHRLQAAQITVYRAKLATACRGQAGHWRGRRAANAAALRLATNGSHYTNEDGNLSLDLHPLKTDRALPDTASAGPAAKRRKLQIFDLATPDNTTEDDDVPIAIFAHLSGE